MGAELVTGIVGIAGVSGTLLTTLISSRSQRDTARTQLLAAADAARTEVRRTAYSDFLRVHIQFEMSWRELLRRKAAGSDQEELDLLFADLNVLERDRWSAYTVVLLEAPADAGAVAQQLVDAYSRFDEAADRLRTRSRATVNWPELDASDRECADLIRKFALATQTAAPLTVLAQRRRRQRIAGQ